MPGLSLHDLELERLLPAYLPDQRWFGGKSRSIARVRVVDTVPVGGALLKLVEVGYRDADSEVYALPLAKAAGGQTVDALRDAGFVRTLVRAIERGDRFAGSAGEVTGFRTPSAAAPDWAAAETEPRIFSSEQSNSSVVFDQRLILKLYRRVETGVNPDLEVSEFLTVAGFPSIAPVAGGLSYRSGDREHAALGMLQAFVVNRGDAWTHALDVLKGGRERAIDAYVPFASLLGRRTAEMHGALAGAAGNADFAPEPTRPEDAAATDAEIEALAADAFALLRRILPGLRPADRRLGEAVVAGERNLLRRARGLRERRISTPRIRCHGDYHLGQVLFTGSDFVIVDFEGEPARSLADRRSRRWAMKDVAGMVRSFAYVAASADGDGDTRWGQAATDAFLSGYWSVATGAAFAPPTIEERDLLMSVMLLEKALYELRYEMNNRPTWVGIPLRGLHALLVGS
jgi:trehalose synthase-fused probable maltokinase